MVRVRESISTDSIVDARLRSQGEAAVTLHGGLSGKAEFLYAELERRLLAGTYRFGESIPTTRLVREFKVSRAPLTAALNELRAAGYIKVVPQVGSQVISPSDQQVRDFYIMFSMVERGMARLAAERRTARDIDFMDDVCRRITRVSDVRDQVTDEYLELLMMYHRGIHGCARSPLEATRALAYQQIATFFLRNGIPRSTHRTFKVSNKTRPALTAAIAAGSPEAAEQAMATYILLGIGLDRAMQNAEGSGEPTSVAMAAGEIQNHGETRQ